MWVKFSLRVLHITLLTCLSLKIVQQITFTRVTRSCLPFWKQRTPNCSSYTSSQSAPLAVLSNPDTIVNDSLSKSKGNCAYTWQISDQRPASLYNAARCHVCKLLLLLWLTYLPSYLLTYLLTAIEFSLGGNSPYTSTDKTYKTKYT